MGTSKTPGVHKYAEVGAASGTAQDINYSWSIPLILCIFSLFFYQMVGSIWQLY